jgi:hypothetical protein
VTRHVVFDYGIAAPEVSQFSARVANMAAPALHQNAVRASESAGGPGQFGLVEGQKLRGVIT